MPSPVNVAVINRSMIVTDGEVEAVKRALQVQVDEHFLPHWGTGATLFFVGTKERLPAAMWWLVIIDDAISAGELGEHTVTPSGLPIGFVELRPTMMAGVAWSTVASHELLEMLADPLIFSLVQLPRNTFKPWPAYTPLECCDWVEGASYTSLNVPLSDFVFPSAFGAPSSDGRFSLLGSITAPFTLAPGGYMIIIDKNGRVIQLTQPTAAKGRAWPGRLSRRMKIFKQHAEVGSDYVVRVTPL